MMRAEESSRAKSRFLFNMSHDIRTPMNAVIGYTHLAAEEKDVPPKVAGYIEKIDQAGKRLLSIINDVLEMSRIESGRMTLEYSEKDIISAVRSSFDMFGDQMAEKKIDYTLDVSDVSDRYVMLDENRFSRVLMNLISNACKFTPEGGSVAVSLSQTGSSGGRASYLLRVKDSGIGMTEKFAKNVFDAFSQERSSTISGIQGTGLGMAITKSIVDLMGGKITVDTAPGKGADFTVTFTLDTAAAPEESADASGAEASGDEASGDEAEEAAKDPYDILNGRRVLLAEDIAVNREIAAAMLGALGVSVETAENGEEAAEAVSSSEPGRFDAVLMDIQMPVMNGYDAAKEIRALGDKRLADVPIIAMTANAFDEDRKKAAECGMNGHIPKPVDPAVLADTLIKAIEGSGAAKQ
ncbi:MAG: response regulator [Clostridia bacterium]|nr:response regulator [Clostridia bacterium]